MIMVMAYLLWHIKTKEVKIMKTIARAAEATYGMHGSKACCSKIGCAAWDPGPVVGI